MSQLTDIGFPRVRCEKAAIQTLNTGVEEAMNWLLAHMDDPGLSKLPFLHFYVVQVLVIINLEMLLNLCPGCYI